MSNLVRSDDKEKSCETCGWLYYDWCTVAPKYDKELYKCGNRISIDSLSSSVYDYLRVGNCEVSIAEVSIAECREFRD